MPAHPRPRARRLLEEQINDVAQIPAEDRWRLLAAAQLWRVHEDADDILSERQWEVLDQHELLVDAPFEGELDAINPRDMDTILTSALELADRHDLRPELADAVQRYRHLTDMDAWALDDEEA